MSEAPKDPAGTLGPHQEPAAPLPSTSDDDASKAPSAASGATPPPPATTSTRDRLRTILSRRTETDGHGVVIVDSPETRVHHPSDLLVVVASTLGIVLVLLLAIYAHGTTTGVSEDVQGLSTVLRRVLFVPVAVLEGLLTLVVPVAVLVELAVRRLWRQVLEVLVAGALGGIDDGVGSDDAEHDIDVFPFLAEPQ